MVRNGDTVFLTGGTGFVGSHIGQALLNSGYSVKALVRGTGAMNGDLRGRLPTELRDKLEPIPGDLLEAGQLMEGLRGCRYVIHAAALYSFAPADRSAVRDVNVRGTASLLEAARLAGVERVVVTSSSATVGPASHGRLATERDWAKDHRRASAYHTSKIEQERVAIAAQIPTVLLLPTAPVGPADVKPTPTGKMIVDFMRGRMFATLSGGLNVVPVEDVADAHVTALTKGEPNERYILGGSNLLLTELFAILAELTSREPPRRQIPYPVAYGIGVLDEIRCRLRPGDTPVVPLEGVQMGREKMFVSSARAEVELGFQPSAAIDALSRSVDWFRAHGYDRR